MAASPTVAEHYGKTSLFFVGRHLLFACLGLMIIVLMSHLTLDQLRRLSFILVFVSCALMLGTLFLGDVVKGARRWIHLGLFKLQPSEILRPALFIVVAWLLSEEKRLKEIPGIFLACILMGSVVGLLFLQPDLGMSLLVISVFLAQIFLAGLSRKLLVLGGSFLLVFLITAYFFLPHVRSRLFFFFNPLPAQAFEERFQIIQSLNCFSHGGIWGCGLGEGVFKHVLPDAHTDFILAVAAEELGIIFCLGVLFLYGVIIVRMAYVALTRQNLFLQLSLMGLVLNFFFQILINIASALGIIPTKGMPLPFISYGGSSMISSAFLVGSLLALSRKQENFF